MFSSKEAMLMLGAVIVGVSGVVFAWQQEQDAAITEIKEINAAQQEFLKNQNKVNENFYKQYLIPSAGPEADLGWPAPNNLTFEEMEMLQEYRATQ